MGVEREVRWSDESLSQVKLIKEFIRSQWTEREVLAFLDLLHGFEQLVLQYPKGYQVSSIYPGCRRAVIHPNVSVVYKVEGKLIEVVTVHDNRSARI
ncbi:MAG: type II toxin-antitoxin system RelE/ParE family toxin [Flavobacteriales bacterium]|nr:type II toxin-antitoxin system RelE/ParE family toxin [Flavobacteriales bacterium]